MDVIVTPEPGLRTVWTLTDRLGRKVGQITRSTEDEFLIAAADPRFGALLAKIGVVYPSLNAALDAVAKCLKRVCQFSGLEGK